MKIIIAPDSFKGSLSATKAALAVKRGLSKVWHGQADFQLFPIADGGEGTVEALVNLTGGRFVVQQAKDPLGRPIQAAWGFLGDGETAAVEVASTCGLTLLDDNELDPARASSYGLGQQIQQALNMGAKKLIVGLGGSCTNDAGAGMLSALGLKLLDKSGHVLPEGGLALKELRSLDCSQLTPLISKIPIVVASDVQNPLTGPCGASAVFGPQKGADGPLLTELDDALSHFAEIAGAHTSRKVADNPGAGAAGGLGAAFMLFTEAAFRAGVEVILKEGNFRRLAQGASLIITGEGRSDDQTVWGKAPIGVAALGKELGVPTVCLSGSLGDGYDKMYSKDMNAVMSMIPCPMTLPMAMEQAETLLEDAAERLARLLSVNIHPKPRISDPPTLP
ncbi:MAG: glycerate kinase [Deltaproteobacteria bacterium]|jgi:glycerate kinase|nr:glycerate kinase [Deltaproteobacteria bacterium]